jgi:polyhydroxyalkanoate depolymerase
MYLYEAYQAQQDMLAPLRAAAGIARAGLLDTNFGPAANYLARCAGAAAEIIARSHLTHRRPDYGIAQATVAGQIVPVTEETALEMPFGDLVHFRKDIDTPQPRVLLVAPMAGHFPTLLRHTTQTLLQEHDVYIADWKSARDVPLSAGRFGTDEYVDYLIGFLERIGPGGHAVAVCQPCPSLLTAVAVMAQMGHEATPRSMVLMAGPVDTRISPTKVNELATSNSIRWFADNLITSVPARYPGAGRHVYPGFLQLSAFMAMNLPRHMRAHMDLFGYIVKGEDAKAETNRKFYDEYFSVADLPAEFYLETVQNVFQEHHLARGIAEYRGRKVDPAAIRRTSLLTVEGERDDICAVGQTLAAHDLCCSLKPFRKKHYVQPGVGHYGVFSGSRWQARIYPLVRNIIRASE